MDKNKEFLKKLKELLEDYDMSIEFTCSSCSDTHGLHEDQLVIVDKENNRIFNSNSWCISKSDIS
jgi:hypothetical protein